MNKHIVLIPGALTTSRLWYHQEQYFHKHCRFHYPDLLNSASILEMAQRIRLLPLKKFTLMGFSMGGYVALEAYRLIPEKIEKLILINSAAEVLSPRGKIERERSLELIDKGKFDFLVKLIFKNSIYDVAKYDGLLPLAQTMARAVGADNYKKQLHAMLTKPDHKSLLPEIVCPTLCIASRQDKVMPVKRSEYMAQNIKNAKLIYVDQCGHMALLEQPNRINKILEDWL